MRITIPMVFSKTTPRTTVFAAADPAAAMRTVYVITALLHAKSIDTEQLILVISDVPFADGEARMAIHMRFSRRTKTMSVFTAVDEGAPVHTAYVNTETLRSQGSDGQEIFLGISDTPFAEDEARVLSGDTFEMFLSASVIRRHDCRLTTAHIWNGWAAHCGADPYSATIAGVRRSDLARRFRTLFSAPRASRGRVDGRVQYYWEGYEVIQKDKI